MTEAQAMLAVVLAVIILCHAIGEQCRRLMVFMYSLCLYQRMVRAGRLNTKR